MLAFSLFIATLLLFFVVGVLLLGIRRQKELILQLFEPVLDLKLDVKKVERRRGVLGLCDLDVRHLARSELHFYLNQCLLWPTFLSVLPIAIEAFLLPSWGDDVLQRVLNVLLALDPGHTTKIGGDIEAARSAQVLGVVVVICYVNLRVEVLLDEHVVVPVLSSLGSEVVRIGVGVVLRLRLLAL